MNSATDYTGSTLTAAQDTNFYDIDINIKAVFRIRFEVANTAVSAGNIIRRLEFREDSGAWTQITTGTNNVRLYNSTNFADGAATTQKLTAVGTFIAGQGKDTGSDTTQISLTNGYNVEDEWCLQFQSGAFGHTYQFRVTNAGATLDTYTVTPSLAIINWSYVGSYKYYDANKFTNPTFYLEANIYTSNASFPCYARLINTTDVIILATSKVGTNATSRVRLRSDAITLVNDKTYRVQVGVAKGGAVNYTRGTYTP